MDSLPDLTIDAVAKLMNSSARSIERWWKRDLTFPPPDFQKGAVVLWKRETIDAYMRLWPWIEAALKSAKGVQNPDTDRQTPADLGQMKKPR